MVRELYHAVAGREDGCCGRVCGSEGGAEGGEGCVGWAECRGGECGVGVVGWVRVSDGDLVRRYVEGKENAVKSCRG